MTFSYMHSMYFNHLPLTVFSLSHLLLVSTLPNSHYVHF
jgi:hypothetical protein